MLNQYISDTQDLLNDSSGTFFKLPRLISYINKSRRRVAATSGCLRVIPPGVLTVPNQEVYPVSAWTSLAQGALPGVQSILSCISISIGIGGHWDSTGQIAGGSWKPVWRRIPFSDMQARFRIYGKTFYGTISDPGWFSVHGVGAAAQIYLAPIPAQSNPMEVDLLCIPAPLANDDDIEPIPYPWTDAIPYWSAMFCLLQQQRAQDATALARLYETDLPFCASVVTPIFLQNTYGATMRSA